MENFKNAATKAPNPVLREIRGFTYKHIQKAVFIGYRKPVFPRLFRGFSFGARSR